MQRRRFMALGGAALMMPFVARANPQDTAKRLTLDAGGRKVDVWEWVPAGRVKGQIAFSHGAASAPWKYEPLISRWVAAGWHVLGALHVDSTDHPDAKIFKGSPWKARLEDAQVLSDHIGRPFIAAGHSFGALTSLVRGGSTPADAGGYEGQLRDPRVTSVVAFSPPGPMPGLIEAQGYGSIAVPAFIQTGTRDIPSYPPGQPDDAWKGHLAAYEAGPANGNRYGLVLEGVDHYFGSAIGRPERTEPAQTAQVDYAAQLALLFMEKQYKTLEQALQGTEGGAGFFKR